MPAREPVTVYCASAVAVPWISYRLAISQARAMKLPCRFFQRDLFYIGRSESGFIMAQFPRICGCKKLRGQACRFAAGQRLLPSDGCAESGGSTMQCQIGFTAYRPSAMDKCLRCPAASPIDDFCVFIDLPGFAGRLFENPCPGCWQCPTF